MATGGLVPSQTYKGLVACADNTAVCDDRGNTLLSVGKGKKVDLQFIFMVFTAAYWDCLKRNLNASKPSELFTKTFRWEHRLPRQDLSSWHLIGFPD